MFLFYFKFKFSLDYFQQNHIGNDIVAPMPSNWLSNILPPAPMRPDSIENSTSNTPVHNHVVSPVKAVNLLPDLPVNHQSRRLTDKEQKDCDVIGMYMKSWSIN